MKRPAAAADSTPDLPSLDSIIAAISSDDLVDRSGTRRRRSIVMGLAAVGIVAPIVAGGVAVMLSLGAPPLTPPSWNRSDQAASLLAPAPAPAAPPTSADRVASGTAPLPADPPDSEAPAVAASGIATEGEHRSNANIGQPTPDHGAASAATTPSSVGPEGSPPPAQEASPESKALAEANSRLAIVEREKDALAAEVARLERQERMSPVQQVEPSPPAAAVSPTPPSASPPVAEAGLDLGAATASLPKGIPGRLLIRYPGNTADARKRAERLANALQQQGLEIADLRESAAVIRTELHFSYAPDEAIARQVGRLVGVTPVRRRQPSDGLTVRPGTVELDLSGDSHLAATRTTSSRENDHE